MSKARWVTWVVLTALVAAPTVRADEEIGRMYARKAQQALADGRPDQAIELIEKARIEWPGSPVIAHTLADARYRQGDYASAMLEYDKGSSGALAFRAFFNKGVTLNALAEGKLAEAGVPLDPAGIPADVDPGPMIEAIDKGLKTLEYSRGQFLDALSDPADGGRDDAAAARESVVALNRRMDELREMKEELEKRQQEQEQEDGEDGEEGEDQEPSEDQQQEDGEQDQEGDQEQEPQDGENQQPQDSENQQQGEGEESQEPTEPQESQPVPGQQTQLSAQEMAQLLEQLEELEDRARAMQRVRRAQQRADVERDW